MEAGSPSCPSLPATFPIFKLEVLFPRKHLHPEQTRMSCHPQMVLNYAAEDGERTWPISGLSAILTGNSKNSEQSARELCQETVSGEPALPSGCGEQGVKWAACKHPSVTHLTQNKKRRHMFPLESSSKWNSKVSSSHEEIPVLSPRLGFCSGFWSHFRPARSEERGKPGPKNPERS